MGPLQASLAGRRYGNATFDFLGSSHAYFIHPYHRTWTTERAVEIPIALHALSGLREGADVLEVGNVLSHYPDGLRLVPRFRYTVVDKFERAPGVVNEDILEFTPPRRIDLVLSISTLEHVGWDEGKDPGRWRAAVARLVDSLAARGRLLATMPVGYNPDVDRCLREGKLPFDDVHYLKRISRDNRWREAPLDEVKEAKYGSPYPSANAILVGSLTAPS